MTGIERQEIEVQNFSKFAFCYNMDDILIANLVSISGADCPLNEYIIAKGPEWPDFDSQPVVIVSAF